MKPRALKIAFSLYFLLGAGVFLLLRNSPAQGYELSVYSHTPLLTWFFLGGGMALGLGIIVHQAFAKSKSNLWLAGFFLILLTNFVLISLPTLRNYFLAVPGDALAHFAWIEETMATGQLHKINHYPVYHILAAQLATVCNLRVETVMGYLPSLISILYMLHIYLLATAVLKKRGQQLLVAAAACVLLFADMQFSFLPRSISQFFFPLLMYLYFKDSRPPSLKYKVPLILLLISFPFIYPHTSFIAIAFLITVPLAKVIYNRVRRNDQQVVSLIPAILSFIVFFIWISSFAVFPTTIQLVVEFLTGHTARTFTQQLGIVQVTGLDLIKFIFRTWGPLIIYGLLSVTGAVIILRRVFRGEKGLENPFFLIIWGVVGEILTILLMLSYSYGALSAAFIVRDAWVPLMPLFAGFCLYEALGRLPWRKVLRIAAVVLILGSSAAIADLGLHRSPWVYRTGLHVTASDYQGTEWLIDNREGGVLYNGISYHHAVGHLVVSWTALELDSGVAQSQYTVSRPHEALKDIPPHFGYPDYETLGEQQERDFYIICCTERWSKTRYDSILQSDRVAGVQEGRWDIDREDFEQLSEDPTVDKLYSNGELDVFYVETR